ncbi:glycosyltransferase [Anaerocolumna sp. MB42-C2]|uniref:glycosyltransferase n=1 Tax=Anaerocolumna sp. MB42-C2 TaxID=3070997 RepID=UPI0027E06D1D|nr:glycosyltransferase [Anaerocolumna sp. MB42-C2]WMJ90212.1 glycosyltransferase [Anaerocolumna sp. MB42-C2]
MAENIIVLKGQSQYNVLRIAADYMIESFKKRGYNVIEFDLTTDGALTEFIDTATKITCSLIFSFQALLFDVLLSDSKTALLNQLNIPVFGHIVDHPIYHNLRLSQVNGDNIYLGCIDQSHVDYVHKYYTNIKNVTYLPHGGFNASTITPYQERSIDLFFPCSYSEPDEIMNKINALPEVYQNMCIIFIKKMLDDPTQNLQDTLYQYLDNINFIYEDEDFTQIMEIVKVVDQYIRAYTRDKCIRYLLDNGITVTVSGNGWPKFKSAHINNLNILESNGMAFGDVLNVMGKSKMVLNHIATHQNGTHERIFTSMMCGAVCLTLDFPSVHTEFIDSKNIILFSDNNLKLFTDRIKDLLSYPTKAEEIAKKGTLIAAQSHSWLNNVDKILEIIKN